MKKIAIVLLGIIVSLISLNYTAKAQSYFSVEVKGKGKPMILIHGLYCTGEVWKETVDRYQKNYQCHIITVAGFGGSSPNLNDHFLESVKDDLITYVKNNKLKKPVLIGHSMGGFISLWAAASAPGLFDRVISVDGVPFMPALQMAGATAESSRPMAENMRKGISNATPEQTLQNSRSYLPMMMRDKERVEQIAQSAMKCDVKTQGEVLYEMFTTDLRETVAAIDCPAYIMGAWIGYKDYGTTRESALKGYQDQVKAIKNCTVEISDTAKHFIFYDEPAWFFSTMDSFLK
ncbi:MAG: alpha/beta hydrolase [Cyclobacteriaceae bacterium]|nr:alpha/beta hydrolase [Cyclobacteriaceae bacterium]